MYCRLLFLITEHADRVTRPIPLLTCQLWGFCCFVTPSYPLWTWNGPTSRWWLELTICVVGCSVDANAGLGRNDTLFWLLLVYVAERGKKLFWLERSVYFQDNPRCKNSTKPLQVWKAAKWINQTWTKSGKWRARSKSQLLHEWIEQNTRFLMEVVLIWCPEAGARLTPFTYLFALTEFEGQSHAGPRTTKSTSQTECTQMDNSSRKEPAQEMASRWKVQG